MYTRYNAKLKRKCEKGTLKTALTGLEKNGQHPDKLNIYLDPFFT